MPRIRVNHTVELYYELHGTGKPVIFINGLTSSLETWYYQVPLFKKKYSVLVYDCRGQGRSDKPPGGYTGEHHTEDLLNLMDRLAMEKAHIVGHSFGGYVAMNFALTHRGRVGALVVSDSTSEANPLVEKILNGWVKAQDSGGMDLRFDISLPWLYAESYITENPKKIALFRKAFRKNDFQATRNITLESLSNNNTHKLKEIEAPMLLIVGDEDKLTPPRYSAIIKERVANSQMHTLGECGHVSPIEKPQEFNALVSEFLGRHDHLL
jgi:3-oxoadipate enol-lactonase